MEEAQPSSSMASSGSAAEAAAATSAPPAPPAEGEEAKGRADRLVSGDPVEVESCDDGFEGCFCEATIAGSKPSKVLPDGGKLRMYEVRYTRLIGARNKPILESVCEHRIRPDPPEVLGYTPRVHDFVDAFWWDGWWHGHVTHVDEGEGAEGRVVHVRFPSVKGQLLRLEAQHVRQHVRYDPAKKEWLKKVASSSAPPAPAASPAAGLEVPGDDSSSTPSGSKVPEPAHEWVALRSDEILERRNSKKRSRARSSKEVERDAAEKRAREKAPMPDLPMCPTLHPTAEEFADPYKYIASIREQVCRLLLFQVLEACTTKS